jgi:hypothetical protein
MSDLDAARRELLPLLDAGKFGVLVANDWPAARGLITRWFAAYQDFERKETFERAFFDDRMSIRWCNRGLDYTFPSIQATPKGSKDDSRAWVNASGQRFISNVGVKGVLARLDPTTFVPTLGGTSRKTELGLHDLSASLLKSSKKITAQLHNSGSFAGKSDEEIRRLIVSTQGMSATEIEEIKAKKDKIIAETLFYVFMPIAKPADQKVFQLLNDLAKDKVLRQQGQDFYNEVRDIRSKMTRVKLFDEHDMGTGFLAYAPDSLVNPRFKYGHQPTTKVRIRGIIKSGQDNTEQLIAQRRKNAVNYDQVLARATGVNEMTIAYRHHASRDGGVESFPLLAQLGVWPGGFGFQCFALTADGGVDTRNQRFIPAMPVKK